VCHENFRRHPPKILGADRRGYNLLTSWDVRANADASKISASAPEPGVPIDLPKEHLRDSSGRTAAAERG
jgi:hypothetical protein